MSFPEGIQQNTESMAFGEPNKHLNLLFYLPSLDGGRAERLLATLATTLALRGHSVLLATDTEAPENKPFVGANVESAVLGAKSLGKHTSTRSNCCEIGDPTQASRPCVARISNT